MRLHPVRGNLAQGAIEGGATTILAAIALGAMVADAELHDTVVAIAVSVVLLVGAAIAVWRYLPMTVEVDPHADEVRYRNAWTSGVVRWSSIVAFEPTQVFVGHEVARALCLDGRRVTLRAAPYEEFVRVLRAAQGPKPSC